MAPWTLLFAGIAVGVENENGIQEAHGFLRSGERHRPVTCRKNDRYFCEECTGLNDDTPCSSADGASFTGGFCRRQFSCVVAAVTCTSNYHAHCEECTGSNEGAPCAGATFEGGLCRGLNTCEGSVPPVRCTCFFGTAATGTSCPWNGGERCVPGSCYRDFYHDGYSCVQCRARTGRGGTLPCKFPFKYRGKKYHGCTGDDYDGKLWCATETSADHTSTEWGICQPFDCREDAGEEIPCDGDDKCCYEDRRCDLGEGDCDKKSHCKPWLECGWNSDCNGAGFDSWDDCCKWPDSPTQALPTSSRNKTEVALIVNCGKSDREAMCLCLRELVGRDRAMEQNCDLEN